MGTENATSCHVACGFQLAAGKRRRGGRARRTKDRRGTANHAIALKAATTVTQPTEAPAVDEARLPSCDATEVAKQVTEVAEVAQALPVRATSCPDLPGPAAAVEAPRGSCLRRSRTWPLDKQHVSFDDGDASVHLITPYAEVYGMHPRLFDFDKGFSMVPAQGFGAARQALIAAAAAAAALAARRARGEDVAGAEDEDEDEDEEEADSEDNSSDDDFCTEYTSLHAPPWHVAQSQPIIASC